ncbi:MAG: SMI1/KNR4 family protein [Planctomycetota bacterium]|nr:MAG: SMI1/KNR4 family protein [Planctomycetota bacterium]
MEIVESLTNEPVSEGTIRRFESALGAELPVAYRRFVLESNGGRPEPSAFRFQTTEGESDSLVDWFYTFAPDEDYNIHDNLNIFRDRIPTGLIPIACDPFGNQILLGVNIRRGEVFFWDHELESGENASWDNISHVATSFHEFLTKLS